MKTAAPRIMVIFVVIVTVSFLSGCTNWQKRYEVLNIEHQNLKGLYENCRGTLEVSASEKADLAQRLSAGAATGFGDKYQVDVDAAAGTITVTLPNKILFASGKANLKKSSGADLNHIISVLKQKYGGRQIDVVGHTDSDPIKKSKWKDNWELSAQRALSVVRYLQSQGTPAKKLSAVGCGQDRPVASNATRAGRAKNRRVEIVVHTR